MKPKVKICGITNIVDALQCVHAGVDMLGFIFYKKSPRFITPARAQKIIRELPSYITPVGVFVNEKRNIIEQIIDKTHLRIIQLSGDESPEDCLGYHVKIWKAFRIKNFEYIKQLKNFQIDAAILEGASDGTYGGSGTKPDFAIACAMKDYHPLVLAGGLTPANILQAILQVKPYTIDINSGVEFTPRKKDHSKINALFKELAKLHREKK